MGLQNLQQLSPSDVALTRNSAAFASLRNLYVGGGLVAQAEQVRAGAHEIATKLPRQEGALR